MLPVKTLPFHAAEEVLDKYWTRFNLEMDAKEVVRELVQQKIIPESVKVEISRETSPKQQNQILHAGLKKSCTKEAMMTACEIIIAAAESNSKMSALGLDMKRSLEAGM